MQITARVSPKTKELSLEAAAEREISHSQWLNEAIVRQLLAEGYDTALEKAFRPRQDIEPLKRRPQRPRRALPEPQEPAYVSANRADKIISLRIDPELVREIDRAREEDEDRSAWFRTAVNTFLYVREAKLPNPHPYLRERRRVMHASDVVYNAFSQAFFQGMVRMFQQDNEMRSVVMTDKDAREQATRHFFKRAQRQAQSR